MLWKEYGIIKEFEKQLEKMKEKRTSQERNDAIERLLTRKKKKIRQLEKQLFVSSGEQPEQQLATLQPSEIEEPLPLNTVIFTPGPNGCMGRTGCRERPKYLLSCPHEKRVRNLCPHCLANIRDAEKCGCNDKYVDLIPTDLVEIYD